MNTSVVPVIDLTYPSVVKFEEGEGGLIRAPFSTDIRLIKNVSKTLIPLATSSKMDIFGIKVSVKVTRSLTLVLFEREYEVCMVQKL